jgi:hypothetical protein
MPDLLQGILTNIPRLGAVLALYPLCFKLFAWIEDRLSTDAKAEISAWLKSTGNFAANQIISFNLFHFHSQLFGDKQFSWKCFNRTILFSFTSFIFVFFPVIVYLGVFLLKNQETKIVITLPFYKTVIGNWTGDLSALTGFLLLFTLVVLPLDFIGIGVTRTLAKRAKDNIGLKNGLFIFIVDTLAKTVIFPLIYLIATGIGLLLVATSLVAVIRAIAGVSIPINIIDFLSRYKF